MSTEIEALREISHLINACLDNDKELAKKTYEKFLNLQVRKALAGGSSLSDTVTSILQVDGFCIYVTRICFNESDAKYIALPDNPMEGFEESEL